MILDLLGRGASGIRERLVVLRTFGVVIVVVEVSLFAVESYQVLKAFVIVVLGQVLDVVLEVVLIVVLEVIEVAVFEILVLG